MGDALTPAVASQSSMRQSPGCRASVFRQHPIQFQFLGGISAYDPTWRLCPIVTQAPQPFRLVMESTWPLDCAAAAPWLGRFSLPRQGHPLRPLRTRQSRWRGIRCSGSLGLCRTTRSIVTATTKLRIHLHEMSRPRSRRRRRCGSRPPTPSCQMPSSLVAELPIGDVSGSS
jgi:hypothetical protein